MFGMIYPADKGSWTSLFCAVSQDMKAEQSGTYFEIFRRFGEPTWQNCAAKDKTLAVSLEEWTKEAVRRDEWVQ
jgi:hypothetical protein